MRGLRLSRVAPTLAALGAVLVLSTACGGNAATATWRAAASTPASASAPSPSSTPTPADRPVHVRLYQADGSTYGVGMPIIAYLSAKITDARAFAAATQVTVNGSAVQGAWHFQKSAVYRGYPLEAHYRLAKYWPAHAAIRLDLPVKGVSGGDGLVFDNSLTLDMSTGAANISRIDGRTERMVVTSDGKQKFTFPVSLGKAKTPTFGGVKVVMEKVRVQRMVGADYDLKVPWSVRVTNSGEFIHAASWNGGNIGQRSTSHGCTNLNEPDAKRFFSFAQIGDVTVYTNTGGPTMPSWDGYGDWNIAWGTWRAGGAVPTR